MGRVVTGVAALGGEVDRHAAILAERQDVEQLLQVGPAGLAVAVGDGRRRAASLSPFLARFDVSAEEGDRGRIVVQFIELHAKLLDHVPHDLQHQFVLTRLEQPIEAASQPIVGQRFARRAGEADQARRIPLGPFPDAVHRLAREHQVPHQHQQGGGGGDLHAWAVRRQVLAQQPLQLHPLQQAIDDRHGPDRITPQHAAVERGRMAADVLRVILRSSLHHGRSPGEAGTRRSPRAQQRAGGRRRSHANQMYCGPGVQKRAAERPVLTYDERLRRKSSGARLTSMAHDASFFRALMRTMDAGASAAQNAKMPAPQNRMRTPWRRKESNQRTCRRLEMGRNYFENCGKYEYCPTAEALFSEYRPTATLELRGHQRLAAT